MDSLKSHKISSTEQSVIPNLSKEVNYDQNTLKYELEFTITSLKSIIKTIMSNLETCIEVDKDVMEILQLIHNIENFQRHVEFLLRVIKNEDDDELKNLKEEFKDIKKDYEKLNSKGDLTLVILGFAVNFVNKKILPETERIIHDIFKKNDDHEMELIRTEDCMAKIKILTAKYEVISKYFPRNATFPKDDILAIEKSSPIWQELYKSVQFKRILSEKEIQNTFKLFRLFFHVGTAIVKKHVEGESSPHLRSAFSFLKSILYYGTQSSKAETQALLYLLNPSIEHAFLTWNFPDRPLVSKIASLRFPRMGYDRIVYLPKLFPRITKDVILEEYKENTINKFKPMDLFPLEGPELEKMKSNALNELYVADEEKVFVRILSLQSYDFNSAKAKTQKNIQSKNQDEAIVIHMHGGGFVSMSSDSHRVYSTRWVKGLKLTLFSIDYKLAPKNPYPEALDDIWQAYLWIVNYAESVLGIKHKKIILTGDSAGGNLVLALTLRLIQAGQKLPHGCFLTYPALFLDEKNCSPSHYNALDDPVIHYNILKLCLGSYVTKDFDALKDPFISPLVASEELLERLPPIRIVTGSEDPLHDDNWRFLYRLKKLNKDIKVIVHQGMGHAYLSYQDLKKYGDYVQEGIELMQELIDIDHQN